jgi:hypothetical protein
LSTGFLNFGAGDFALKFLFKKCFTIVYFLLWRQDPLLELQFLTPLCVVLFCFATRWLQIALQWLREGCLVPWLRA